MKKRISVITSALFMSMLFVFNSFADGKYGWQKDDKGWWWNSHSGYPKNCWLWIDGNNDNIVECYYFDNNGYMLANTTTPDGYYVNADGQWTVNGVVQNREFKGDLGDIHPDANTKPTNVASKNPVTDANSVKKITPNRDMYKYIRSNFNISQLNDKTKVETIAGLDSYNINYNGSIVRLSYLSEIDQFTAAYGPAKVFFNNIPEQGIELNAFYDSLGKEYESPSTGRRAQSSTSISNQIFGLTNNYRYCQVEVNLSSGNYKDYMILLTPGDNSNAKSTADYKWYIYPDSIVDLH